MTTIQKMEATPPKQFYFDWYTINPETFRGPGLSFPLEAELHVTPDYGLLVMAAIDSFPGYGLVPPEDIIVHVMYPWELDDAARKPFNKMTGSDLGLRLHYIDDWHMDLVLNLKPKR